jgi:hypothetical protein
MPSNALVANADEMKRRMYEFLDDLVPAAMRGKEQWRGTIMVGAVSFSSVEYENVRIVERQIGGHPFGDNRISVMFKSGNCPGSAGQ